MQQPDPSDNTITGFASRTLRPHCISPSRLALYWFDQPLMNLCALWLHQQDKDLKGLLPLLSAQSCGSEDSPAISPGRDKHPILTDSPAISQNVFFLLYIGSVHFCRYLLAASRPSADLTGYSFWLLPERLDWHSQDRKKRQQGVFFSLYCHSQTCTECKDASAMPGLKISRLLSTAQTTINWLIAR